MITGKWKRSRAIAAVLAATLLGPQLMAAQFSGDTVRTEKEQQKRLAKLEGLDAAHFARSATIEDDAFETTAKITTANGFVFKGGQSCTCSNQQVQWQDGLANLSDGDI